MYKCMTCLLFLSIGLSACSKSSDDEPVQDMSTDVDSGEVDMTPAPVEDMDRIDMPLPDADMGVDMPSEDLGLDMNPPVDMPADMSDDMGPSIELPDLSSVTAAVEADLAKNNATAASISIYYKGEVIWLGGFGTMVDGDGVERKPDKDTLFMIGSDTKKHAVIAYLQHVALQQASVDSTIHELVPALEHGRAPDFTSASAHDLMSNQGGLVDDLGFFPVATQDAQLERYIISSLPGRSYQLAPPGEFYNYSNPSFSMLGLMTEKIDSQERYWADIIQQDLFSPLGMNRSVARKSEVDANHATGMGFTRPGEGTLGRVLLKDTWEDAYVRPAGLIWSTPSDQMRLAKFLIEGNEAILPDHLREDMLSAKTPLYPDIPGSYGYGVLRYDGVNLGANFYPDVTFIEHGGNTITHTSKFYVLPEQNFAISILGNGMGDNFDQTAAELIRLFVELPAPGPRPEVTFDPSVLDKLVGDYYDPNNLGRAIVTRQGDRLVLNMPDVTAAGVPYEPDLVPISSYVWRANIQNQDMAITFFEGSDSTVYLTHRAFVAIKTPPLMNGLQAPLPEVEVSPERIKETLLRAKMLDPLRSTIRPW